MTVSIWQESEDPDIVEHDDVVIGAGIVGGWAATALADRGRDVAIFEARFPAAGATGRNAGFVMTNQREHYPDLVRARGRAAAKRIFELVRCNVATMREQVDRFGIRVDPAPIRFARDPEYADALEEWARALDEDGFPAHFERQDPLGMGHLAHMVIDGDFCTQPAQLAEGIVRACGAHLYENNEVFRIERTSGGYRVHGRRTHAECQRVWICTNGTSGLLHPWLRARVRPARGQVILTHAIAPGRIRSAGISGLGYFRQLPDGRVLMGGARSLFEADEYTAADWNTEQVTRTLLDEIRRLLDAPELEIDRQWTGTQGFTADRSPIVGTIPDEQGLHFAVGFSGYGNSMGLVAAERMVEHALDGADLGPLDAERLERR